MRKESCSPNRLPLGFRVKLAKAVCCCFTYTHVNFYSVYLSMHLKSRLLQGLIDIRIVA